MKQKDMNNVKWRCPKCGSTSDISQVHCGRCGTDLLVMGKLVYVDDSGNIIGEVTAEDSARIDIPFVDIENNPDSTVTPEGKKETRQPEEDPIHQMEQESVSWGKCWEIGYAKERKKFGIYQWRCGTP